MAGPAAPTMALARSAVNAAYKQQPRVLPTTMTTMAELWQLEDERVAKKRLAPGYVENREEDYKRLVMALEKTDVEKPTGGPEALCRTEGASWRDRKSVV